jgi:positive regulator of sigma E activity
MDDNIKMDIMEIDFTESAGLVYRSQLCYFELVTLIYHFLLQRDNLYKYFLIEWKYLVITILKLVLKKYEFFTYFVLRFLLCKLKRHGVFTSTPPYLCIE